MKIGDKVKRLPMYCNVTFEVDRIYIITYIQGKELRLKGVEGNWDTNRFVLVVKSTDELIKEGIEMLENARAGKGKILYNKDECVVNKTSKINIIFKSDVGGNSCVSSAYMEKNNLDYVVVLLAEGVVIPVALLTYEEVPKFKEVKLNNSYTAKVYKDKIVVGCQEFPIMVISELFDALNKIQ